MTLHLRHLRCHFIAPAGESAPDSATEPFTTNQIIWRAKYAIPQVGTLIKEERLTELPRIGDPVEKCATEIWRKGEFKLLHRQNANRLTVSIYSNVLNRRRDNARAPSEFIVGATVLAAQAMHGITSGAWFA